jgi:hypothetical protein
MHPACVINLGPMTGQIIRRRVSLWTILEACVVQDLCRSQSYRWNVQVCPWNVQMYRLPL